MPGSREADSYGWPVISEYFNDLFSAQNGGPTQASPEEIREACFSIYADKAPGPDGFSASFFQSNWETVAPHVILEIQAFFQTDTLPRNINTTHIRLIPKIQSPKKVAEYRPIALCTVYYKIISKILTLRLQPVLKISGAQKRCFMAVKTDMSKAYDRIEWDFIGLVLERLGFHKKRISYSFCAVKFPSGLCSNAQKTGRLTGIRVAKGSPRISHLLFADDNDTMFFCRSDDANCLELMRILGLPELFGRKKKDLFNSIIDRIRQRTLSWSSRFLSSAGKTTMQQSVLAAMPTYTMSPLFDDTK